MNNFNYANNYQAIHGPIYPDRAIKQNNACLCCLLKDTIDQDSRNTFQATTNSRWKNFNDIDLFTFSYFLW